MRPERTFRALFLAALLLAPWAAQARWYQVEVVVFRHTGSLADGGEQWAALDALPDFSNTVEPITDMSAMDDEPAALDGGAAPVAFEALDSGERRLAGVARRLRSSGNYEVLLSAAWRQPSFGVRRARRVYLTDAAERLPGAVSETQPLLAARRTEGIVSIKVSRLLHVEVDFLYYHDGSPVRLAETRKVLLREIHYFDHPLFGVIVQVSPFVLPEVATTTTVSADEPEDPAPESATNAAP